MNALANASNHPGSASASLLSSATNSVSDAANPWLLAAQKPRFSLFRMIVGTVVYNHHLKRLVYLLRLK
jgi:hypothetical protein